MPEYTNNKELDICIFDRIGEKSGFLMMRLSNYVGKIDNLMSAYTNKIYQECTLTQLLNCLYSTEIVKLFLELRLLLVIFGRAD